MPAELIADLDNRVVDEDGREYFVNVAAEPVDGRWEAWLEFVPTDDSATLITGTETSQSTREAIRHWATTLDDVYLEGAFERAIVAGDALARTPVTVPVDPVFTLSDVAAFDPFAVYAGAGELGLRAELRPLTRAELMTMIDVHDLDPAGLSLARLTNTQLVTFIVTAVEIQTKQGRR